MTYFWCEEQRGKAANAVLEELRKFVKTEMTSVADQSNRGRYFPAVEPYV